MKRFTKQTSFTTVSFYQLEVCSYHSNGHAPCWITKCCPPLSDCIHPEAQDDSGCPPHRLDHPTYFPHRDTSFHWAPSSENKGTPQTVSVGRTVYCDGIGICMHISTNLLIVVNHINWDVLELTCIEEVHSLTHDVCADKHNSIISSVIIWDVLTTVFYEVTYTLCIDVTTSEILDPMLPPLDSTCDLFSMSVSLTQLGLALGL